MRDGAWCILRTQSADTLRVANSLTDHGFTVWTPVEKRFGRLPRRKARAEAEFALMKSYVFGRAKHLDDFMRLAMFPNRDHPPFSIFHHKGGIPLIADEELSALREEEDRCARIYDRLRKRNVKPLAFDRGAEVRTDEGGFAGLPGIVEGTQGQYTLVSFAGFHKPIKVQSLLLRGEHNTQPETAALAA